MAARSSRHFRVREEVLNVRLAELLTKRGLLSIPETIIKGVLNQGRNLPDITLADLWGVRIVIEGRTLTTAATKRSLFADAKKRVEQGISPICLAVLYPENLREVDAETNIASALERSTLTVRVISEGGDGEWTDSTVDGLVEILHRSYELLVNDDVVVSAVGSLESSIEEASTQFAAIPAAPARLRKLLGIPEDK
jgi:hypothetical protein